MERAEYGRMFTLEDGLWWYRAVRLYLADAVAALPSGAAVLDAGCGSGGNMVMLAGHASRVTGCDLSLDAIALARRRGLPRLLSADVNALPFRDRAFDGVVCCDVLECDEVDESRALAELARVTRRGGRVILTVPAYQFLLSEHDHAIHSVRRYTIVRLRAALRGHALRVLRLRYLFGWLLPAIVGYRVVRRLLPGRRSGTAPRSDLFLPPGPINQALLGVSQAERAVGRWLPLPFGTTILAELEAV